MKIFCLSLMEINNSGKGVFVSDKTDSNVKRAPNTILYLTNYNKHNEGSL